MLQKYRLHPLFKKYYGEGPWTCEFCKKKVKVYDLTVHHRNEDRDDHSKSNLAPCHKGCHIAHHNQGRKHTDEQRARQAEVCRSVFTGRRQTEDHKRKIGEANKGKVRTEEMNTRLSEAHKGKRWSRAQYESRGLEYPSDDQPIGA